MSQLIDQLNAMMKPDKFKSAELEQGWLVVSERFGDLVKYERLIDVGAKVFSKAGRGATTTR